MVTISNFMHRFQPKIGVHRYLYSNLVISKNMSDGNHKTWLNYLEYNLKRSDVLMSEITTFMKQTTGLALYQAVYTSKLVSWFSKSKSVQFLFDDATGEFEITVPPTDLLCINQGDSLEIKSVSGKYSPTKLQFEADGGKVVWDKNQAVVTLKKFNIDLSKPEYSAKGVELKHPKYLSAPIFGTFTDKASPWAKKNDAYPEFVSNDKYLKIKSIATNMSLQGQFRLQGSTATIEGTERDPAIVEILQEGKKVLVLKSVSFTSREIQKNENNQTYEAVTSNDAEIAINFGKGNSITHPSCKVELTKTKARLDRNSSGKSQSLFVDEYHGLEYDIPAVDWTYTDKNVHFSKTISLSDNNYMVRSTSFYTEEEMEKLRMMDDINPLFEIWDYLKLINRATKGPWIMEFTIHNYVKHINKKSTAVKSRMKGLAEQGFVRYYESSDTVIVQKKLVNWVKHRQELRDYDNMTFNFSKTDSVMLDLNTSEMVLGGVNNIIVNIEHKVAFMPEGAVRIKENRNMSFNGFVAAGDAVLYGKSMVFEYDSMQIRSSKFEGLQLKEANSLIEDFGGKVHLPKNIYLGKDTLNKENYPQVVVQTKSKVYYDKNNKQGDNTYKRENFYFTADPFVLKSTDKLKYDSVALSGRMTTGGIVPDFNEKLKMMPDNSLGVKYTVPDGTNIELFKGLATLKGDGTSSAQVVISNRGLEAEGQVDWLTATVNSKNFMFTPDKVTCTAKKYTIKENIAAGGKYPEVVGDSIAINWSIPKKEMIGNTLDKPMNMYAKRAKFSGETSYTPESLRGKGDYQTDEGYFKSKKFVFETRTLTADSCNFSFLEAKTDATSDKPQEIALQATEMRTFTDMDKGKTVIQTSGDKALVTLPKTEYEFTPSHMIWTHKKHKADIDFSLSHHTNPRFTSDPMLLDSVSIMKKKFFKQAVFLEMPDRTKYTSIKKGQERLNFKAKRAKFDGVTHTLTSEEVITIDVADITVRVREGDKVVVEKGAKMNTLVGTTVTALKHTIHKVDINILGKNEYVASAGIYHYEYPEREGFQEINFSKIKYDAQKKASVAEGDVMPEDTLMLNDYFQYTGKVHWNATEDLLRMEGFARIQPFCDQRRMWFNFDTKIQPDSVVLPLENNPHAPVSMSSARCFGDVLYAKDSIYIFPAFLANDPFGNSGSIYSVAEKGNVVRYEPTKNTYQISTPERLRGENQLDDLMEYNTKNCEVNAYGKFGFEALSYIDIQSYTRYRHELPSNHISIRTFSTVDFFFNSQLSKLIADSLKNLPNMGVSPTDELLLYGLNREIGIAGTSEFMAAQSLGMGNKFPDSLNHTIVFSQLVLEWDQTSDAFKSKGELGILSIGDVFVNKTMNGYVRIKKGNTATGDYIDIYLEPKPSVWFYFKFTPTRMTTGSSSKEYYQVYKSLKSKDLKAADGRTFGYTDGDTERNMFIYEFTGVYPK